MLPEGIGAFTVHTIKAADTQLRIVEPEGTTCASLRKQVTW